MARDALSTMTRLVEARVQIRQAREAVADDRPELAASLAELVADMDELRWKLTEEGTTGQSGGDDRKRTESEGSPE